MSVEDEDLKKAREIGAWLYGPDEGLSEGLVRTLIDKIASALKEARKEGYDEAFVTIPNPSYSQSEIDRVRREAFKEIYKLAKELKDEGHTAEGIVAAIRSKGGWA